MLLFTLKFERCLPGVFFLSGQANTKRQLRCLANFPDFPHSVVTLTVRSTSGQHLHTGYHQNESDII